jgi:hypothetical protein
MSRLSPESGSTSGSRNTWPGTRLTDTRQRTDHMRAFTPTQRRHGAVGNRLPQTAGSRWRGACLSLLLCCLPTYPAMAWQPAPEESLTAAASQINRLAAALADAPESMRADFAVAAITELVLDYDEEADRARREARSHGRDRDLGRWAIAVDTYAAKLTTIANSVTPATPVTVAIGADNSISLDIDGTPVLVSSPRVREQSAFEQRVLDRFCNLYPCTDLIAEYRPAQPAASTPTDAETYWSFSQQAGPTCSTGDGLEFQFQDMKNIGEKRKACGRIVKELNALAAALAWHLSNGSRIDWNRLAIHALPGEEEHQVELSGDGRTIRLPLPALAATTRLFKLVRPWLAAKVGGLPTYRLVVINADSLMAPLIHP